MGWTGEGEKSSCDANLEIAAAKHTGSPGSRMTLQSWSRVGQDAHAFIFLPGQSLGMGCLWKAKRLSVVETIPKGSDSWKFSATRTLSSWDKPYVAGVSEWHITVSTTKQNRTLVTTVHPILFYKLRGRRTFPSSLGFHLLHAILPVLVTVGLQVLICFSSFALFFQFSRQSLLVSAFAVLGTIF